MNDPLDGAMREAFGSEMDAPGSRGGGAEPAGRLAPPPQPDAASSSIFERVRRRVGRPPRYLREHPHAAATAAAAAPPGPLALRVDSSRRPRYRVTGEIARGGVGAVLRGQDTEVGREVAIKVLLAHHGGNDVMVRRFLEEARVEGRLEHPGVVPVHEIGFLADARPFFTMKLVKGETLAALLRARSGPAADRRRFLGIFEKVLETMAYAHAQGVIHRDLKPANIMVGAFGEVQVMDWGLSKVLGGEATAEAPGSPGLAAEPPAAGPGVEAPAEPRSETGSVMGTPSYMPPEQARGEVEKVDARSDVFSLGAILCEILTGRPPFTGSSAAEVRDRAAAARLDGARGRLVSCGADRELVRLVTRCLAADPATRPSHAGEVAGAFSAYLASLDERARKAEIAAAEARVKAAEEWRARRLTLALAAAVSLAILAAGAAYLWIDAGRRHRIARTTAAVTHALEDVASLRGAARAAPVEDVAAWDKVRAVLERAEAVAAQGDVEPAARERLASLAAATRAEDARARAAAARALKDRAMVERLEEIRLRAADLWDTAGDFEAPIDAAYGDAFRDYGIDVDALATEEAAARIRVTAIAEALVVALDDWTSVRSRRQRPEGDPYWKQPLQAAQAGDSNRFRRELRSAWRERDLERARQLAGSEEALALPAATQEYVASVLGSLGDVSNAIAYLEKARYRHPGDFWIHHLLGHLLTRSDPPQRERALEAYRLAVAVRPASAAAWNALGAALWDLRQLDEAERAFRQAIRANPGCAVGYFSLAQLLETKGDLEAARAACEAGVVIDPHHLLGFLRHGSVLLGLHDPDRATEVLERAAALHPHAPEVHFQLGLAYSGGNQPDSALAAYGEAIRLKPDFAQAHNNLGVLLEARGEADKALAAFQRAIEANPWLFDPHLNISRAWYARGELEKAVAACREATRIRPQGAEAHAHLGYLLVAQGQHEDAAVAYRRATELEPQNARYLNALAKELDKVGRSDEAAAIARQAIGLEPDLADAHYTLGVILVGRNENRAAAEAFQRAIDLDPPDLKTRAQAWLNLGSVLYQEGRIDEALAAFEGALKVDPEYVDGWANLSAARARKGDLRGALEAARRAVEIDPRHAAGYYNLGLALERFSWFGQAAAAYRRAVELQPRSVYNRLSLASVLRRNGELDAALATAKEVVGIAPDFADTHFVLGEVHLTRRDSPAAIEAFRDALRCQPDNVGAHFKLGALLHMRGDFAEALRLLERGRELDTGDEDRPSPFDRWIHQCRRSLELEPKLAAILRGEFALEDAGDQELVAGILHAREQFAAAARVWEALFASHAERIAENRYSAACAAARAASGAGKRGAALSAAERARWRTQALAWLRDDLDARRKARTGDDPKGLYALLRGLASLRRHGDLAGIRDEEPLANLPASERQACNAFWREVATLQRDIQNRIASLER